MELDPTPFLLAPVQAGIGVARDPILYVTDRVKEGGFVEAVTVFWPEQHVFGQQRLYAVRVDALGAGHTELAAEDVRLALRALGEITGRVDVEQVLDRLFASFCIGK